MADRDLTRPAFRYSSAGRRPERLNQSRDVNVPVQLARGWAAGLLGLPGDVEGLVRMLPGIRNETPVLPTSDFYREALPGYDPRPAARALSGLGALTGGAGATSVVRGGLGAVKRAADPEAIRQYVRATQGMTGLPGAAVVKPKGGNWLAGADSPENAVRVLKRSQAYVGMPPAELEAANASDAALNTWIDQKLAKYIRNEMATPEDPLRALIQERGVSHLPLEQLQEGAEWLPDGVVLARRAGGFPEEGMALERHAAAGYPTGLPEEYARAAQGWEVVADTPITPYRAGRIIDRGPGSEDIVDMYLRENPWLAKVPPETPVYSLERPQALRYDLGFSHLVDELRNAVTPNSGLPRELQLKPEQLSRVTMPQAVELVDRINKWRAAQAAAAQRAALEGIPVHKEYPEGYRWLAAPDTATDPRSLKYVQDVGCKMGLCTQSEGMAQRYGGGGRQLFVLHDPEGRAVAQVAVKPSDKSSYSTWYSGQKYGSPEIREFERYLNQNRDRLRDISDAGRKGLDVWYEQWARDTGRPIVQPAPEIVEIKGKQNRAPKEEHLPYVQDFVRSGQWGRVGDLGNTGLVEFTPQRQTIPRQLTGAVPRFEESGIAPGYYTEPELMERLRDWQRRSGAEPGYAAGGLVSSYDPARIDALTDEILASAA